MGFDKQSISKRFPRSTKYNPEWLLSSVSGAANALWLSEWLAEAMDFRSGMRVLDLGCGRAVSSIFLRREFDVEVWATDLWFSATENMQRVRDANVDDGVFPIHADARSLPFASEFFDAIVCLDSFPYFGTDDCYLNYLARFVKPGGAIGIAGAGLIREMKGAPPAHLRDWWTNDLWCLHSVNWWRDHWQKTGILDVHVCDTMPDGWRVWLDWHKEIAPDNRTEIKAIQADRGRYIGYVRVVGHRNANVALADRIESIPTQYTKKPLLRS
ncbi:MAG TPA: class I SAM-dependent methyltransferase [Candidatus Cybelea sp.]|nr:class I SAM-dependent methyltransferase [Candidatus Cybelea sp.]